MDPRLIKAMLLHLELVDYHPASSRAGFFCDMLQGGLIGCQRGFLCFGLASR